ncbi:hypothetical protein A6A07_11360 [Streptomyces sp. CB03911]|nr:hypothetical protein A6A07_11360 [Streptomyces sp. CB03911]
MIAQLIAGESGAYFTPLDHERWADKTELSVAEVRAAFAYLIDQGLAYVDDGMLVLLTARRRRELAEAQAAMQERAARQGAKVALRGGQVNRKTIPAATRAAVRDRDGHRCVSCGAVDDLTLDHIYPWSLGGSDTVDNLRVLCRPCNSRKGDQT